jgi:hypothetical protein
MSSKDVLICPGTGPGVTSDSLCRSAARHRFSSLSLDCEKQGAWLKASSSAPALSNNRLIPSWGLLCELTVPRCPGI